MRYPQRLINELIKDKEDVESYIKKIVNSEAKSVKDWSRLYELQGVVGYIKRKIKEWTKR